jgi:hypothetical protein
MLTTCTAAGRDANGVAELLLAIRAGAAVTPKWLSAELAIVNEALMISCAR